MFLQQNLFPLSTDEKSKVPKDALGKHNWDEIKNPSGIRQRMLTMFPHECIACMAQRVQV